MGLTPEQLDQLVACGFEIALRPYFERRYHAKRNGVHHSIDFERGTVTIWGTTRVLTFEQAIREFGSGEMAAAIGEEPLDPIARAVESKLITADQASWLRRCERAGIRITDGPRSPAANCSADFCGEFLALLPWTQSILSRGCKLRQLSEFEQTEPLPITPIVVSGRTKQPPSSRRSTEMAEVQPELFDVSEVGPRFVPVTYGYASPPGKVPKGSPAEGQHCRNCANYCRLIKATVHGNDRVWRKCRLAQRRWTWGEGTEIRAGALALRAVSTARVLKTAGGGTCLVLVAEGGSSN